eukprot:7481600-Pyramimonas_sp.AAC.1
MRATGSTCTRRPGGPSVPCAARALRALTAPRVPQPRQVRHPTTGNRSGPQVPRPWPQSVQDLELPKREVPRIM